MPWQDSWPHRSEKWYPESMTGWGSPHESTALPEVTSHKVMAATLCVVAQGQAYLNLLALWPLPFLTTPIRVKMNRGYLCFVPRVSYNQWHDDVIEIKWQLGGSSL